MSHEHLLTFYLMSCTPGTYSEDIVEHLPDGMASNA